jgi:YHS domain-containing protein
MMRALVHQEKQTMFHMTFRRSAMALFAAIALTSFLPAAQAGTPGSTSQVNIDEHGLALRGYDPVAYFDGGKPTRGVATISASYGGARYLFASEAHRAAFVANPVKYVPQFGGYCALGTSEGEKVDANPETGKVVGGKLYVNYNEEARAIFDKDTPGTIAKAEKNWPKVKDKAL